MVSSIFELIKINGKYWKEIFCEDRPKLKRIESGPINPSLIQNRIE